MRQFEPPESAQRLTTSFGYYGSTQNRTVSNCRSGAFLWDPTDAKFDWPVTLPPGRARLANQTRPHGIGNARDHDGDR